MFSRSFEDFQYEKDTELKTKKMRETIVDRTLIYLGKKWNSRNFSVFIRYIALEKCHFNKPSIYGRWMEAMFSLSLSLSLSVCVNLFHALPPPPLPFHYLSKTFCPISQSKISIILWFSQKSHQTYILQRYIFGLANNEALN